VTAAQRVAPEIHDIENWFKDHIATLTGTMAEYIDVNMDFDSFGIDSIQGVDMITALELWLGVKRDIPLDLIFDAGSIEVAAQQIASFVEAQAMSS
jgi:acyl carrier protein